MLILAIAYLGGVLTILSPCVLPVLPFVFARAGQSFRSHGLPMLLGMALAFAGIATLAAVGGAWVVALNQSGRFVAIALLAAFGAALAFPAVADRLSRPFVALGARLSPTGDHAERAAFFSPLLLGAATGLLWTPCAGPILGLILTGAALNGANAGTSLLLLAYAAGAATSLAVALLAGGRLLSAMKGVLPAGSWLRRGAGVAVLAGVGSIALGVDARVLSRITFETTSGLEQSLVDRIQAQAPRERTVAAADGVLGALSHATEWINSPPLTAEGLRGKVVLVDFWTYSCINCLRTLPYVRAWADKYRDAGLVVIGVHTPEFAFEKLSSNVRRATRDLGISFPVAMDNDFRIWRGFRNNSWPAFHFIDAQGRLRHVVIGENQYADSERMLRQLLVEAGKANLPGGLAAPEGQGVEAAPGSSPAFSGETYVGHDRARNFASPGGLAPDRLKNYEAASSLRTNQWSLAGPWTVAAEKAVLAQPNGRIAFRFHARDLHLVLGPGEDGKPVRFRVRVDGQAPLADHGSDTDAQGQGTIDGQRLYQLVRLRGPVKDRLFEIEFLDAGAQAYAFTFG
jgi:cytochrome c biogenesis protein CcdA/thiol-disulfide isomerase/thioredoxin